MTNLIVNLAKLGAGMMLISGSIILCAILVAISWCLFDVISAIASAG